MISRRLFSSLVAGTLGIALSVACAIPAAHAEELTLVPGKSEISFVGSKPDGKHKGGFKKFTASADANFEEPSHSSLQINIDTPSLWADDDRLANHLKSPDFFDVRKHPAITFESTEIVPKGNEEEKSKALIKGDLYMLGKKVAVDVPVTTEVTEESIVLDADFTIDRTRWGMTYGEGKINNEVKINARLTFKR